MAGAGCESGALDPPRALGVPPVSARLRASPEDFRVEEELGFAPDGDGQHLLVQVRKRGCNTAWVAGELARAAGVRPREVGYSGLKDRDALTSQWFSLDLAGRPAPDWAVHPIPEAAVPGVPIPGLPIPGVEVLAVHRHRRKLRRGSHRANRFVVVLRDVIGDRQALAARLEEVAARGVPNYFGPQRFGRGGANVAAARDLLLAGRAVARGRRGILLSAARSLLFNRMLAARVPDGSWAAGLPGDMLMLDGTASVFPARELDEALRGRLAAGDLHPAAPLWGRGEAPVTGAAREVQEEALAACDDWCRALAAAGLELAWRSCRLPVADARLRELDDGAVELAFRLPRGAFATAVLRELAADPPAEGVDAGIPAG